MSFIMEKIAPALLQQYDALPSHNLLSYKHFQLEMDNTQISVSLVIQRLREDSTFANEAKVYIDLQHVEKNARKNMVKEIETTAWNFEGRGNLFKTIQIECVKNSAAYLKSLKSSGDGERAG